MSKKSKKKKPEIYYEMADFLVFRGELEDPMSNTIKGKNGNYKYMRIYDGMYEDYYALNMVWYKDELICAAIVDGYACDPDSHDILTMDINEVNQILEMKFDCEWMKEAWGRVPKEILPLKEPENENAKKIKEEIEKIAKKGNAFNCCPVSQWKHKIESYIESWQ